MDAARSQSTVPPGRGRLPKIASLADTYADLALGAQQYRPQAVVPRVIVSGPTCPTCGDRVHQWECAEFRKEEGQLSGWHVRVQKCTSTKRQPGSRDLRCGWREKTLLSPIEVSSEVAQVFDDQNPETVDAVVAPESAMDEAGPQEEVMALLHHPQELNDVPTPMVALKSSGSAEICPECGGSKRALSDRCRKCFLAAKTRGARSTQPKASLTNGTLAVAKDTPVFEEAFSILMSRPGYVILPLLMALSPDERQTVEQAVMQLYRRRGQQ